MILFSVSVAFSGKMESGFKAGLFKLKRNNIVYIGSTNKSHLSSLLSRKWVRILENNEIPAQSVQRRPFLVKKFYMMRICNFKISNGKVSLVADRLKDLLNKMILIRIILDKGDTEFTRNQNLSPFSPKCFEISGKSETCVQSIWLLSTLVKKILG